MTVDTNSLRVSQAQSEKSNANKTKTRRHLDHLPDLQNGNPFTMVPRVLIDAWLNGHIPEKKMKLLCCLMSHAETFKVKRAYLLARFDKQTLAKYMKELIDEGYVRVERVPRQGGGFDNLHHVNPMADWELVRNPVEGRLDRRAIGSPGENPPPLNKTKGKTKKKNNENNDDEGDSSQVDVFPKPETTAKPKENASSSKAVRFAVRLEWLYKKSRNGSYDWQIVNDAASQFLESVDCEIATRMIEWVESIHGDWAGRLRIEPGMFHKMLPDFLDWQQNQAKTSLEHHKPKMHKTGI